MRSGISASSSPRKRYYADDDDDDGGGEDDDDDECRVLRELSPAKPRPAAPTGRRACLMRASVCTCAHIHTMPGPSRPAHKSASASCAPIVCHRRRVRGDLVDDSAWLRSFRSRGREPRARNTSFSFLSVARYTNRDRPRQRQKVIPTRLLIVTIRARIIISTRVRCWTRRVVWITLESSTKRRDIYCKYYDKFSSPH